MTAASVSNGLRWVLQHIGGGTKVNGIH